MGLLDQDITYKHYDAELVASLRIAVKSRKDIFDKIKELTASIPPTAIKGPPFVIFYFVTSVKNGHDVEIGFPIKEPGKYNDIKTRTLPALKVLSLTHTGSHDKVSQSYGELFKIAYSHGLISDEFGREVYTDWDKGNLETTEIHFIIHDWHALFTDAIERILDTDISKQIMGIGADLAIDSDLDERFNITKTMIKSIDDQLGDDQKYDIVSRCAHKFPKDQLDKLRNVYLETYDQNGNALAAVDAVIEFMANDPGWGEKPMRKGNIIYSSKAPRDPQAFEKTTTVEERKKAYCFCPIIRDRLNHGMPVTFCYCGAGWYRQQWEGAIGKPVRIKIVESLLKGDERCRFAIHLPEDL